VFPVPQAANVNATTNTNVAFFIIIVFLLIN
jgi:hypothetical protein